MIFAYGPDDVEPMAVQTGERNVMYYAATYPEYIYFFAELAPLALTPREEFEARFGPIDDEGWEWLKEFTKRNDTATRVSDVSGLIHRSQNITYSIHDFYLILKE